MRHSLRLACAAFVLLSLPGGARGQAGPTDPSIDRRVQVPGSSERARDEMSALLTGHDDILLMQRTKFFTFSAGGSMNYIDNAALSPTDRTADGFATADAAFSVGTRLGGTVHVYAQAGLSTSRYFRQVGLDYVAGFGAVGADMRVAGFDLDAAYTPVIIWDGDWRHRQLIQHRFSGSIGRGVRLGRAVLLGHLAGERIEAHPAPYTTTAVLADASLALPLTQRLAFLLVARGGRRWYDNYFEGILGVHRRDWTAEGSAALSFRLAQNVSLEAHMSYTRNWSTSDVSRYEAFSGGANLRVAFAF